MSQEVIAPLHDLTITGVPFTETVSFAPDGKLYLQELTTSFNAWAMLVHYWPEVLGTLLGLVLLILSVPVLRMLRRPRTRLETRS